MIATKGSWTLTKHADYKVSKYSKFATQNANCKSICTLHFKPPERDRIYKMPNVLRITYDSKRKMCTIANTQSGNDNVNAAQKGQTLLERFTFEAILLGVLLQGIGAWFYFDTDEEDYVDDVKRFPKPSFRIGFALAMASQHDNLINAGLVDKVADMIKRFEFKNENQTRIVYSMLSTMSFFGMPATQEYMAKALDVGFYIVDPKHLAAYDAAAALSNLTVVKQAQETLALKRDLPHFLAYQLTDLHPNSMLLLENYMNILKAFTLTDQGMVAIGRDMRYIVRVLHDIVQGNIPHSRCVRYNAGVTLTNIANNTPSKPAVVPDELWTSLQQYKNGPTEHWDQHILPETLAVASIGSAFWSLIRHRSVSKAPAVMLKAALGGLLISAEFSAADIYARKFKRDRPQYAFWVSSVTSWTTLLTLLYVPQVLLYSGITPALLFGHGLFNHYVQIANKQN